MASMAQLTSQDPYFGKTHSVFEKDVYRVMKTENSIQKSNLVKKPAGSKSLLEFQNCKYKPRSRLIMEQYENPQITEDQLYVIDKVVRMRGKGGRFGVDHSEILIHELELANRDRDSYLNNLVYKQPNPYQVTNDSNPSFVIPPSAAGNETS
jgi:hypothetical protein